MTKAIYGATGPRWGDKYRGVTYRGFTHELFTADGDNFGPTLAIRTGPADYSRRLQIGLHRNGLRNFEGYVWKCEPCQDCMVRPIPTCKHCQGTELVINERLSVPTERDYFTLAGMPYAQPSDRV